MAVGGLLYQQWISHILASILLVQYSWSRLWRPPGALLSLDVPHFGLTKLDFATFATICH